MIQENTSTSRSTHTYAMVTTAFMAAVTCILAPLSIPIGPVPISLTNLAIYLSLYLLNWKRGTISYSLDLAVGSANWQDLPVAILLDLFPWRSSPESSLITFGNAGFSFWE